MPNQVGPSRRVLRLANTLIVLAVCMAHCALQVQSSPVISKNEIVRYLTEFGYLASQDAASAEHLSTEELSKAIASFQSFMKMDVTGKMDPKTIGLMTLPRCGVKDKLKINVGSNVKSEAYKTFESKWGHKSLTYKIINYPSGGKLSNEVVDKELARAFAVWSAHTDLTFTPQRGEVDIEISFVSGHHGDDNPFDGSSKNGGSVLAHAYSPGPGIGGDAHFDDDEPWTYRQRGGTDLFQVAAHEFGHALGLDHSGVPSALMAPYYRGYEANFQLDSDDISGIQALYGSKTRSRDPPVREDPSVKDPSVQDPSVEDPNVGDPSYEDPSYEDPTYEDPSYEDPFFRDPHSRTPVSKNPFFRNPVFKNPFFKHHGLEHPDVDDNTLDVDYDSDFGDGWNKHSVSGWWKSGSRRF